MPTSGDSQSVIYLAKNLKSRSWTKHIRVKFHSIKEVVEFGEVTRCKVKTPDNVADAVTKAVHGRIQPSSK